MFHHAGQLYHDNIALHYYLVTKRCTSLEQSMWALKIEKGEIVAHDFLADLLTTIFGADALYIWVTSVLKTIQDDLKKRASQVDYTVKPVK
jgi:hypothetical protein